MALPRTLGELQLYRVLQRANLLSYYETFIQQGGDDVRQLCEAGEEEFLEIMALVGMAAKPLHVRRLQKALREWAAHPGLFGPPAPALPARVPPVLPDVPLEPRSPSPPSPEQDEEGSTSPGEPEALEPALVRAVAEGVERLLPGGPRAAAEPEPGALQRVGRRLARAVGHVFQMDDGDRRKAGEIRRLSAIYGRGEGRRREGRRLSLQEVSGCPWGPRVAGTALGGAKGPQVEARTLGSSEHSGCTPAEPAARTPGFLAWGHGPVITAGDWDFPCGSFRPSD